MSVSAEPYRDCLFSLLAFCKKFAEDNPSYDFVIEDFDGHADINEFEDSNYIGIMEYEFEDDEGPIEVTCALGIMMFQDTKIQSLRALMSQLMMRLRPGTKIPLVVSDTGARIGTLTVARPTRALPISREAKNRPVQFIGVRFLTDLATVL